MLLSLQLILGLCLLIGGAELLVRGASRLSLIVGVSPLLVGLTIVAYGTSAPELAVNILAILEDPPQSALVVGNIVGSNISNILLILGITAMVAPLAIERRLVTTTLPFMVLVSASVYLFGADGTISRGEGGVLFAGSVLFTGALIRSATRERRTEVRTRRPGGTRRARSMAWNGGLVIAGLGMLLEGADLLVHSCTEIARLLNVSELVIGLSIVAVGTSLPELATSIVAALDGRREIAVGNLVGSNIFNILLVLGICALLTPGGVHVPAHAINFDILLMIAVAVACIPIFATNFEVGRWEAGLLLGYYMAYIFYLYLSHPGTGEGPRREVPLYFWLVPLLLVILFKLLQRVAAYAVTRSGVEEDGKRADKGKGRQAP